jgi:RIO kinase 1
MYTDTDRFRDTTRAFKNAGYITGDGQVIKQGKEAAVLACPAHPSLGVKTVALKVYKDQEFRNFRNDAAYLGGRVWKRRDRLHLKAVKDQVWVETEFAVLGRLHEDGVRVPRPFVRMDQGIVMEFITQDDGIAAPLREVRLDDEECARVYREVIAAIEGMLRCGIVHGDLSAFNILYDGAHAVIIDFPQAVSIATHDSPFPLFVRDVENVLAYFTRCSSEHPRTLARDLWEQYYLAPP